MVKTANLKYSFNFEIKTDKFFHHHFPPKIRVKVKMFTYTNPRKSLSRSFQVQLRKTEQSPLATNRKRTLFRADNLDENISPSKVNDPEHAFPETSFNKTPTLLSPTPSEKFESLISKSENEQSCSSSIATMESSTSLLIEHNTITPLKLKNVKGVEYLSNENLSLNKIQNNKADYEVKACSYGYKKITPEDFGYERVTRSHYDRKVKAKPFKDSKSTSKKRPRSTSKKQKTKINLFPDVILPKIPKQSSSKKNVWTEYMHQDKPKRILLEQDNNRRFFKSKVIHNDTSNKKKDNGFNLKGINWNDENSNNSRVELNESSLNSPKILNDNNIDKNVQNINKLELLDGNHNENSNEGKCLATYPSPSACHLKEVSNSLIDVNDTVINELAYIPIDSYDSVINEFAAIDASVLINESSQTNLFPIFINETPPLSRIICSSEEKNIVRKERRIIDNTQYQIYAGLNKFGGFLCKECGFCYSSREPEDEAEHDKYHKTKDILKYKSSKNEKVIFKDIDECIVVISGSDTKTLCSKALEVMLYVDKELGCYTECSVLPANKKVHLYIKKRQVIGCLVIDLISQACRLETESEDMIVLSKESYPVKAGVNSIWTKWDCRNTGIARKLLDYFRKNYTFGHILTLDEIAFTVPTRSGKQFIKKYTNRNDFLVYTGW